MGPVFELQITPQNHYYYLLYHSPLKKREGDVLAEKLPAVVSGIVTEVAPVSFWRPIFPRTSL